MYRTSPVETPAQWKQFIDLPFRLYRDDPTWVPPLRIAVRDQLDRKKNPFFKHAEMRAWMTTNSRGPVGRVVAVIDHDHNRFHEEKTCMAGYFEAVNDQEVAAQLFDEVKAWAKAQGMDTVRGPINLSTNYEAGLLIDGFEDSPFVMMNYNPPYYAQLFERNGFAKKKDLFAYNVHGDRSFDERLMRHAARLAKRNNVSFRTINMKEYDREVDLILDIYNDAWEKNWGFVPTGPEEFHHIAKDMKAIVDPNLILIAEVAGEPAGFALTLPDVNQAFKQVKDGKLFPTGLWRLLWNLKGPGRKRINRCRILTLGIRKKYQKLGLGPMLYAEYHQRGPAAGYNIGEASWILEDNLPMNKALTMMKADRTKVYRVYDHTVN